MSINIGTKLSPTGEFKQFEGFTIICNLKYDEKFDKLHKLLSNDKIISNHYSLLPVSSYHMTLIGITSCKNIFEYYTQNATMLKNINSILVKNNYWSHAKFGNLYTRNTIGINILPYHIDDFESIYNTRINIEKQLNKYENCVYHMTFGYLYKNPNKEDSLYIKNTYQKIMNNVFINPDIKLIFDSPQLCYYKDMTEFKKVY